MDTISLLGHMTVAIAEQPITFATESTRALFAYLIMHRGRPFTRLELATLLWPDLPDKRALHNLRMTLTRLRQALGKQLIAEEDAPTALLIANRVHIQARATYPITIDVEQISEWQQITDTNTQQTIRRQVRLLEKMCLLYRGSFLADVRWESPLFETWVAQERERWQQWALMVLARLSTHYAQLGLHQQVIQTALKQVELEPWHENAHQQLMESWLALGQRAKALAQFEKCRAVLQTEFGVEPGAPIMNLWHQAKQDETPLNYAPSNLAHTDYEVGHLPHQLTRFFGREKTLDMLESLLLDENERFVTVVGAGGTGKTRISLACGERVKAYFPDGVWFVSLVTIAATEGLPDLIATTIAQTMHIALNGRLSPLEQLCQALAAQECLIILDNFEHLLDAADVVPTLLNCSPNLAILCTSREPLYFQAEYVHRVAGLAVPSMPVKQQSDLESSYRFSTYEDTPSWQLFMDRAQRHGYSVAELDVVDIIQLCRFVDGHPLALELIASMLPHEPLSDVVSALPIRFDQLKTRFRDVPSRHRTLHAVFESSWRFLDDVERQALAALSVFRGQFSVVAACAVAQTTAVSLQQLVDKSLLQVVDANHYLLHEAIRQFAAQKCAEMEQEADAGNRHAAYYLTRLTNLQADLHGLHPLDANNQLQMEIDSLQQAWYWAVDRDDWAMLAKSLAAMVRLYDVRGEIMSISALLDAASAKRALLEADPTLFYRMLVELADILYRQGKLAQAKAIANQLLEQLQPIHHPDLLARTHQITGNIYEMNGQVDAARTQYHKALQFARRSEDGRILIGCLNELSYFMVQTLQYQEEALAIARTINDSWLETVVLNGLAISMANQGHYEMAYTYFLELASLDMWPQHMHHVSQGRTYLNLANISRLMGQYEIALSYTEQALQIADEVGNHKSKSAILLCQAEVLYALGQWKDAWQVSQQTLSWFDIYGSQADKLFAHNLLGLIFTKLEQYEEAATSFKLVLQVAEETDVQEFALISHIGYATLLLLQNQLAEALVHAEHVLAFLAENKLNPTIWPMFVYAQTVYVLMVLGDVRAHALLQEAETYVQALACTIQDEKRRKQFLTEEMANKQLMTLKDTLRTNPNVS